MSAITIAEFVRLAENRLAYLGQQQVEAQRIGDAASLARIEAELAEVQQTLTQLRSL